MTRHPSTAGAQRNGGSPAVDCQRGTGGAVSRAVRVFVPRRHGIQGGAVTGHRPTRRNGATDSAGPLDGVLTRLPVVPACHPRRPPADRRPGLGGGRWMGRKVGVLARLTAAEAVTGTGCDGREQRLKGGQRRRLSPRPPSPRGGCLGVIEAWAFWLDRCADAHCRKRAAARAAPSTARPAARVSPRHGDHVTLKHCDLGYNVRTESPWASASRTSSDRHTRRLGPAS